jgi:hypothetical protein
MQNLKSKIRNAKLRIISLSILCSFILFPLNIYAEPGTPEKLTYNIYWAGIRAGSALFEVKDEPEGLKITSRVRSSKFISIFYKVDDFAQSTLYPDGNPSTYVLKTREGRHRKDRVTLFRPEQDKGPQKVIYNNRLDDSTVEFDLEKQAFDPLSGFYEIRKRSFDIGRSEYLNIFDSKKLWEVEVKVLRKEKIRVPAGEFDTVVIKPLLKSEGIFSRKGEIHIWLTDDDKRIPVMVKSKIKIGSFKAKLVEGAY